MTSITSNLPKPLRRPYVLVYRDGPYTVAVNEKGERIVRSTDCASVLSSAVLEAKNNILFIMPATYTFTELLLEDIVIYATPFVLLNGTLKILGDVFIFGYPKVKAVDTSQADTNNRNYYLEVDVLA